MTKAECCSVAGCDQWGVSSLSGTALCRGHFISACYAELERLEKVRNGHGLSTAEEEKMRRFIRECSQQAEDIGRETENLGNLERARLLHIWGEVNDLGRRLRRSPRKTASIAVRLSCDTLGGTWEEDTETIILSRYGATVQCSHQAKPGERLQVVRPETGQHVRARVAWQRPSGDGHVRLGLEFVDSDNFWGLDWASVDGSRRDRR